MNPYTYILIDVANLSYRNWFALGGSKGSYRTPVVYGLLRDLGTLSRSLQCSRFVFCFDDDNCQRKIDFPSYKATRTVSEGKEQVLREIKALRKDMLPELGFKNLFRWQGGEADDVIGYLCQHRKEIEQFHLVSSDTDLYQCLESEKVQIWNPATRSPVTEGSMWSRFKIKPSEWADVKAMTGCMTDNIPGIPGIGLGRATEYIRGQMKGISKYSQAIRTNLDLTIRNKKLVSLPYFKLPDPGFKLVKDSISVERWNHLVEEHGYPALYGKCPT